MHLDPIAGRPPGVAPPAPARSVRPARDFRPPGMNLRDSPAPEVA